MKKSIERANLVPERCFGCGKVTYIPAEQYDVLGAIRTYCPKCRQALKKQEKEGLL